MVGGESEREEGCMTSSLMTAQVTLSGFIMCNLSYGGAFLPVFILLLLIFSIFFSLFLALLSVTVFDNVST